MAIQKAAAETAVKHVTLELGGKNPLIIFPDADLDKAAAAAVRGMNFGWQGQSCGSSSRLLLHESIHDAVVERVIKKIATLKIGNPVDPAISMGPINSKAQFEKVKSYIKLGQEEGARLVFGGGRPAGEQFQRGYWIEPTVFTDVTMSMRVAREEIFGPVLSVLRWKDVEEALTMANAVDYGLTGAVFTKDLDNAMKVAQRIDAGYIWVNEVGPHYRGVPYGGFKKAALAVRRDSRNC